MKVYEIKKVESGRFKKVVCYVSSKKKAVEFIKNQYATTKCPYSAWKEDRPYASNKWSHEEEKTLTEKEILNWAYSFSHGTEYYLVNQIEVL